MKILVTGCAGFIGSELCIKLNKRKNVFVVGIDSLNNYYSKKLKKERLKRIKSKLSKKFKFYKININNKTKVNLLFKKYKFNCVVNLAAQPGVRYSLINPEKYISANLDGFFNILENCKKNNVKHFVFASSSSVYGASKKFPLGEKNCDYKPIQLYAATKQSNELMAFAYSSLFNIKISGIRYFTVYGPWGRPDMLLFKTVKTMLNNKHLAVYNFGKHERDFTYIDDAIEGTLKIIFNNNFKIDHKKISYRIFNIGNGKSIKLMDFINSVEKHLNKNAKIKFMPKQKGDVIKTFANISKAKKYLNFKPKTNYQKGIKNFVKWYLKNEKKI